MRWCSRLDLLELPRPFYSQLPAHRSASIPARELQVPIFPPPVGSRFLPPPGVLSEVPAAQPPVGLETDTLPSLTRPKKE